MKVLKLLASEMSLINVANANDENSVRIGGIHYIDSREIYKKVVRGQKFESLEAISQKELTGKYNKSLRIGKQFLGYTITDEETKVVSRIEYSNMIEAWTKDYRNVLSYNLRDVMLIKRLDEKLELIEYLDSIRRIAGVKYNDCLYAARISDVMYLRITKELGLILYTRSLALKKKDFSGGKVFTAKKGKHSFIICLDFKSMYPNIMRCFNVGHNTYCPNGDIKINLNSESGEDNDFSFTSDIKSWSVIILDELNPLLIENSRLTEEAKKANNFEEEKKLKRRRMGIKSVDPQLQRK